MDGDEQSISPAERRRRLRSAWWVIGIACLLGLAVFGAKGSSYLVADSLNEKCIRNVHLAEMIIYHYGQHEDRLPTTAEMQDFWSDPPASFAFRDDGPLLNPFTGKPVEYVSYSDKRPGSLTYIPINRSEFEELDAISFYLIAHGDQRIAGRDIDGDGKGDHVAIVLAGSMLHSHSPSAGLIVWDDIRQPPAHLDTAWKAIQWAEGTEE